MKTISDYVASVKEPKPVELEMFTRVSVRVDNDMVMLMDAIADGLNKSRSTFGGEVLEAAITEVGLRLGYELVDTPEGVEVGIFEVGDE